MCAVGFALDFAAMAAMTAVPFFVFNQLGGGAQMSGLFGASQGALYTIVCLASASVVQRSRNGLDWAIGGMAGFGILVFAGAFFRSPVASGALFAAGIASLGFVWPALHSWVGAHPDPHIRARRMSWFNISWSFGFALSPLVAGPLYDVDYRFPFVLVLGLVMAIIALVRSVPHERDVHTADEAPEDVDAARIEHSEQFIPMSIAGLTVATALGSITRTIFPKRIDELVTAGQLRLLGEASPLPALTHASATKYSWLAFGLSVASACTFLILGRTKRWQHNAGLALGLQSLAALSFWFLGSTRSLCVMLLCFVTVGANIGLAFFSSLFYCVANPDHKHRRAAINEGAVGTGGLVGSLVLGYLVERFGHAAPYQCIPVTVALAVVVQLALLRAGRSRRPRSGT